MHASALTNPQFEEVVRAAVLNQWPHSDYDRASVPPPLDHAAELEQITRAIEAEFLAPSLTQQTADEFLDFWLKQTSEFLSALRTYSMARRHVHVAPQPTWQRWDAAFAFAGEAGETALRVSAADLEAASRLVRHFGEVSDDRLKDDRKLVARYNLARGLALGASNSMLFAAYGGADASLEQRSFIPMFIRSGAGHAYGAARDAALLRGVDITFDLAAVSAGWKEPCGAMFEYLAVRAPDRLEAYVNDASISIGLRMRAVEAVAKVAEPTLGRRILLEVLQQSPAPMKEAAVYALQAHLDADALNVLRGLAADASGPAAVREAAADVLAES